MKTINRIFALIAGVAALASCAKYGTYTTTPYVALDAVSYSVAESVNGTELVIPVHLYNHAGACTVTYTVTEVSAQNGVDFTPLDNSGVLNFAAGTDSLAIKFNVTGQPGTFTGNLAFRVKLESATNDVRIGASSACTVTVADLDHPLTDLFGTYTYSAVTLNTSGNFVYASFDITISAYEGNPYRVWIDYITPWQHPNYYGAYCKNSDEIPGVYAEVAQDMSTITIPTPQSLADLITSAFGGVPDEHYTVYTYDDPNDIFIASPDTIVFNRQEDGSYITTANYGLSIPSEYMYGLFYYYMNVWGDFNPNYPARFVKK